MKEEELGIGKITIETTSIVETVDLHPVVNYCKCFGCDKESKEGEDFKLATLKGQPESMAVNFMFACNDCFLKIQEAKGEK